jgi:hypothetical protein
LSTLSGALLITKKLSTSNDINVKLRYHKAQTQSVELYDHVHGAQQCAVFESGP